jgi:hypothetical protein
MFSDAELEDMPDLQLDFGNSFNPSTIELNWSNAVCTSSAIIWTGISGFVAMSPFSVARMPITSGEDAILLKLGFTGR